MNVCYSRTWITVLVNNQLDAQFFSVYVYFDTLHVSSGDRGGTVVKVLRYKSEGRCWFDSRWCHWNLH